MNTPGRIGFDFAFNKAASGAIRPTGDPLRVLVLADVSGRSSRNVVEPLAGRIALALDLDHYEAALGKLDTTLKVPDDVAHRPLRFRSLEDFHPDALVAEAPELNRLADIRRRLASPGSYAAAAAELEGLLGGTSLPLPSATPPAAAPAAAATESTDALLSRLLGKPAPGPAKPAPPATAAQAFIRNVVGDPSAPRPAAGAGAVQAAADAELSRRLRALLHAPAFQALEAAWRSVDFLMRRRPDDEKVRISLLDVSAAELAADPAGLTRFLRDHRGTLVVADTTYGGDAAGLRSLHALAGVCGTTGATLLAGAHPLLLHCRSLGLHPDPDDWTVPFSPEIEGALRTFVADPAAAHVKLALPRFLLRLPYGKQGEPVEAFPFEEFAGPPGHEQLLWGNPAFLRIVLRATAAADGSETPGHEVGELPVYHYRHGGESVVVPCAEAWLTDRAVDRITGSGLAPVISVKGTDRVRIPAV